MDVLYRTLCTQLTMGWLRLVGSFKFQVSFAKEPYKTDDILQKRHIILRSLLIVVSLYYIAYFHTVLHALVTSTLLHTHLVEATQTRLLMDVSQRTLCTQFTTTLPTSTLWGGLDS